MWIMPDFSNRDAKQQEDQESPSKHEVDGALF
jgi:hypothetical protein